MVEWVEPEPLGCPSFADERVGREALQGLEPTSEVVGGHEVSEMRAQLIVRDVVEALDGGFLDGKAGVETQTSPSARNAARRFSIRAPPESSRA